MRTENWNPNMILLMTYVLFKLNKNSNHLIKSYFFSLFWNFVSKSGIKSYQDQVSEIVALKDHYKFKPIFFIFLCFSYFWWIKNIFFFCHLRTKGFRRLYRLEMSQFFCDNSFFYKLFLSHIYKEIFGLVFFIKKTFMFVIKCNNNLTDKKFLSYFKITENFFLSFFLSKGFCNYF